MITNQHFVPSLGLDLDSYVERGDISGAQHVIRYLWAIETLAERPAVTSLVDLGCGDGYGAFAIALRYPGMRVVGIDFDEEATASARRMYSLPNLEFHCGDAMRWNTTIGDDAYDCVISFDSIEHVEHRELYLEGVVEHLAPTGFMMLSTPCGGEANDLTPEWSAHKIEYSARCLYDFLARYFRTIRRPDDGSLPQLQVFKQLEETGTPYLLKLNPVLCEEPIRITSPYPSPHRKGARKQNQGVTVFAGDWDGSGVDLPGLFDAGNGTAMVLHLDGGAARWEVIRLGVEGLEWHALAGDWTGQGRDTLGFYNAETARVMLFDRNTPGAVSQELDVGVRGINWLPVAGRWNAGARDTVGLFDPTTRMWYLDTREQGASEPPFCFGPDRQAGLVPLAGRWSHAAAHSVGIYSAESANFYFKHAAASGVADLIVNYGGPGSLPVVGDWDGDGIDTVGICSLADGCFHLRNVNSPGIAQVTYELPAEIRSSNSLEP